MSPTAPPLAIDGCVRTEKKEQKKNKDRNKKKTEK